MRAFKKGILIASALTIGITSFFFEKEAVITTSLASCQPCTTQANDLKTVQCKQAQQDSGWFSWLTGDSRSAQFHYLDLLELLTSHDEQQANHLNSRF
ncbi:hypothetical protein [Pseudoalteromonas mariniglutinosa]|uniref:hypothetical protein n=1 Tax=Pseudoalteromonas mariniglutinosa TaxID=206042 RepID=UPI00384B8545